MTIDSSTIVTATEANQNISKVARIAEIKGRAVVFKDNRSKLLVIDLYTKPQIEMTEEEKLEFVAARILKSTVPHLRSLQNAKFSKEKVYQHRPREILPEIAGI